MQERSNKRPIDWVDMIASMGLLILSLSILMMTAAMCAVTARGLGWL